MAEPTRRRVWLDRAVTLLVLAGVWGYLLFYFKPSLLLLDTMDAGGDTPSFYRPIHHLKDVLLPAGNPQGWDLGNFAGYAPYQFYFLPPSLGIVLMSYVIPLNVAFKLMSVVGAFLLPLCTTVALRALGFRFPVPAIGAAASLIFLFNENNSMWGGNIPSTLAGEFAYGIAFALAILFTGLLYRGVETQRGWRLLGALLALTGLTHPIAYVAAAAPGAFFVFRRRDFARNLRFLVLVYGMSVLLMGFWLVPLAAKLGYATSINWEWHFSSIWDLVPRALYPVIVLAALDALWVAVRRREEDRPTRYLLFTVAMMVVVFVNATNLGLPEIRFVPMVYFLLVMLALDFVRRVLPLGIMPHVAAIALAASCIAWAHANTSFIPGWIKWNYEGLQRKGSWPLLQAITKAVAGPIGAPRVAYENSPQHDRFGSMRVFENMALLSGRATLEGVLLQTAVNSPFIYWLQSQISKQGTGVIPGYSYPQTDLARATPRLALYNANDMIALTPEVTQALEHDSRWVRTFQRQGYSVFHLKDADPHYVRVPKFRPVLVDATPWKRTFHRWFATDAVLDVPIVPAASVTDAERGRFPLRSASPTDLPREPIDADCRIDETVDHLRIEFTTTCPGLPHIVAVAYYPNWHVEGASAVHLVSPAFMLVFPDGPRVTLTYRRIAIDWIGIGLTLLGLAVCVATRQRAPLEVPAGAIARTVGRAQPLIVTAAVVAALGVTGFHALQKFGPQYFYQRAWKAFEAQDYTSSLRDFERALWLGRDTNTAADAAFFRAASLLRSDRVPEALAGYEEVIRRFPDSMWVTESQYHVGLCLRRLGRRAEAAQRFQYVVDTWPGNRWAGFSSEQLQQMRNEPGGLGG
jgi:6-pyruvoyl-tetrahydropterin synthase related domain